MNLITNPETLKKIKDSITEICNARHRILGEKEFIREATKAVVEEHKLDKKLFNKAVDVYFNQNYQSVQAQHEEFEIFYETLTGTKKEEE